MNISEKTTTWPERLLRRYAPHLVEHLGLTAREWADLQVKANARMEEIAAQMPAGGEVTVPATLLDHAVKLEIDHLRRTNRAVASASFLEFLDTLVVNLITRVPPELMPTLRQQTRDIFINFSLEQSKYKEKLGELLAIDRLAHRLGADIVGLEVPIAERPTTLDVALALPSQKVLPVEILNVQLTDDRIENEAGLMTLIDGRIKAKVKQKFGVDIADASLLTFPLQLVVWFQRDETLQRYGTVLASRENNCPFELPICTLQLLGDGAHRFEWRFGSIAELIQAR